MERVGRMGKRWKRGGGISSMIVVVEVVVVAADVFHGVWLEKLIKFSHDCHITTSV